MSNILYDPSIYETRFEIAVGNLVFETFVHRLNRLVPFDTHVTNRIEKPVPPPFPKLRRISRIAEFHLTSGLVIEVHESSTPSPCDVVCRSWTTALMNFVTEPSFGCAYPRLTLNYHAILCDGRVESKRELDYAAHDNLRARGLHSTSYSPQWPQYNLGLYTTRIPTPVGCGRSLYACPMQGRCFGDPGSLVVFFDGFHVNLPALRYTNVAPYVPMTAWRIPTKIMCQGRCLETDPVLPPLVISIIIQFMEGTPRARPTCAHRISEARISAVRGLSLSRLPVSLPFSAGTQCKYQCTRPNPHHICLLSP